MSPRPRETLLTWREALAARLTAGGVGVLVFPAQPDRVSPPCVWIEPDVPYVEGDETTTLDEARVNYVLCLVLTPIGTVSQRLTAIETLATQIVAVIGPEFDQLRELGVMSLGEVKYVAATLAAHTYVKRK